MSGTCGTATSVSPRAPRAGLLQRRNEHRRPPLRGGSPLREAVGFRARANTRLQGDAGMGVAIAYFSRIGVRIGIPLTDSQPYDLMIDDGGNLSRVQVRTTTVREGRSYVVGLKTVGGNKTQLITKVFDPTAYECQIQHLPRAKIRGLPARGLSTYPDMNSKLERATGFEPALRVWKTRVLTSWTTPARPHSVTLRRVAARSIGRHSRTSAGI